MTVKYPFPTDNHEHTNIINTRGMSFENSINLSNEYYLSKNIAVIYKKPTPIQVVRVDYPKRSKAKIIEAYYKIPSTTDYNGIYKGKYLDYEAKETQNLSFSFTHIFPHQIEHLLKVKEHKGLAFIIICFKKVNEIYIIDIDTFVSEMKIGMKSIKISRMKELGVLVEQGYKPPINYLKAVDTLYFSK